jgi:ferric-dicitrate binding protein FerR (iron transport regulator)
MYRNDHEAALARIDALESELEQSRAERNRLSRQLTEKRVRPAMTHKVRKAIGAVLMAGLCVVAIYARVHHSQTAAAETAGPRLDAYGAVDDPARAVCELP